MFPKIKDWQAFILRVALICQLLTEAVQGLHSMRHVLSVDEKTGIQAVGRLEEKAPESKGGHRRKEFEYKRNGTTTLMAAFDVGKGNIVSQRINPTRTEEDFVEFIKTTVEALPAEDEIVFLADQLNTHMSETLVKYVAKGIHYEGDLGKKGSKGILKSMEFRKDFLENPEHRVRFVYTPKHCSWLNPIENWFAKLQRHIIKNEIFLVLKSWKIKLKTILSFIIAA